MSQKKTQKKKKFLRRAERWATNVPGMAVRLFIVVIAVIVMGLMFSALQALDNVVLRIVLSVAIASGMIFMHFADGLNHGVRDAGASAYWTEATAKGHVLSAKDDAACYHPMKGICAALLAYGVFLALGVYVALNARDYTYMLQDLPVWLTDTYGARADVVGPLAAYSQSAQTTMLDWIRLAARLPELLFINFFPDPQRMSGLVDRLTPLMLCVYPASFIAGYLCGPSQAGKRETMNKRAKKIAVRKAQRSTLAEELVRSGATVHYGQNAAGSHKKKELI